VKATRTKRRIVVADDSKFWRDKIATVLSRDGHEVIPVESGIAAIRHCMDPMHPVDMVVVDLIMPSLDGFEVARYLRAERLTEKVPIIGVTGLFKPEDFPEGPQAQGFDAILEKSASPDQFLFVFNKHLHTPRVMRRPAPRVPTHIAAQYRISDGRKGSCVVANLSTTGAFLSTLKAVEPETEMTLSFALPEGPSIRVVALVVWVNENKVDASRSYSRGMGVLFKKIHPGTQASIERFVKDQLSRH
jgi:CheY-like chemotaxis protein